MPKLTKKEQIENLSELIAKQGKEIDELRFSRDLGRTTIDAYRGAYDKVSDDNESLRIQIKAYQEEVRRLNNLVEALKNKAVKHATEAARADVDKLDHSSVLASLLPPDKQAFVGYN